MIRTMWLAALTAAALAMAGCAARPIHGVSLAPGAAPAALQDLAHRADAGDKGAQLELGRRYESGDGVPVDLRFAERLYVAAATAQTGMTYIYQPPIGNAKYGTVMPIRTGPDVPGLPAAREALRALRQRPR